MEENESDVQGEIGGHQLPDALNRPAQPNPTAPGAEDIVQPRAEADASAGHGSSGLPPIEDTGRTPEAAAWDQLVFEVESRAPQPEPEAPQPRIRLEKKHPLAIRWMHWINFPVLFTMIWSGLLIYWGDSDIPYKHPHQVYRIGIGSFTLFRFFPTWFWRWYHAPFQITTGLGYHFFFMWFFIINGFLYVAYTIVSGEWRFLLPTRSSFREAIQVTLHDLHLRKEQPPRRKFNGAQQIAYTSVVLMGFGSLVTGLAIYKPTQAHWVTSLLGGYETARWLHFWLAMGYCFFFLIHVGQVVKTGWNNFRAMLSGYEIVAAEEPPYTAER